MNIVGLFIFGFGTLNTKLVRIFSNITNGILTKKGFDMLTEQSQNMQRIYCIRQKSVKNLETFMIDSTYSYFESG